MKIFRLVLTLAIFGMISFSGNVSAQEEMEKETAPPPPVRVEERPQSDKPKPGKDDEARMRPMRPDISGEEREALVRALRPALSDEQVRSAQQELRRAADQYEQVLKTALLREDPNLAPILDKMPGMLSAMTLARSAGRGENMRGGEGRPRNVERARGAATARDNMPAGSLPDPEIMNDPRVQAAREEVESATTRPERMSAMQKLRQAVESVKAEKATGSPTPASGSGGI